MIKAVNMNKYRFGKLANISYKGFGMYDTESDTFVSYDGIVPYVLTTKKMIESCILADWPSTLKRVAHA